MTTTDHSDKVKQLRSLIRRNVCKSLRVVMGRGTAWGNVHIKGSGKFGEFNLEESASLKAFNFNFGANCGIIMYEEVDRTIARLEKLGHGAAVRDRDAADREYELGTSERESAAQNRTETIDQLISAMLRALQTVRTLDQSENIHLDEQARQQVCAAIMAGQRLQLEFNVGDVSELRDRVSTLEQNIKLANELLLKAYDSAPDRMLPVEVSNARITLQSTMKGARS